MPPTNNRKKPTSATEWKKPQGYPLEVPSGNVALVKPVGMQAFLKAGMIPNSLRSVVMEALSGKAPEMDMSKLDEQTLQDMMTLFDTVTVYCTVQPKVFPVPVWTSKDAKGGLCPTEYVGGVVPPEVRESSEYMELHEIGDRLYVDEVDDEDKVMIFNYAVGGTRSVESFREEYSRVLGSVSGRTDVAGAAEPVSGSG